MSWHLWPLFGPPKMSVIPYHSRCSSPFLRPGESLWQLVQLSKPLTACFSRQSCRQFVLYVKVHFVSARNNVCPDNVREQRKRALQVENITSSIIHTSCHGVGKISVCILNSHTCLIKRCGRPSSQRPEFLSYTIKATTRSRLTKTKYKILCKTKRMLRPRTSPT